MKNGKLIATVFVAIFLLWGQPAFAAMSNEALLKKLNELSDVIQKQQQQIEQLRQDLKSQRKSIDKVQQSQDEKIKTAVKAETKEAEKTWREWIPKWTENIKISGDLRLRYEAIWNRERLQADGSFNDVSSRNRYRIRARLFFDGKISDEVSGHFMICTNQDAVQEATTTNQSFDNDFNDKGIYLHRAYGTYKPEWLPGFEVTAGKFKNTFMHTDIMWDPDVNPEGIYERYQYQGWKNFKPFIHLGQMVINEINRESDDAALYVNQLGFDWKIGPVKWTLAGGYYEWSNLHNSQFLKNAAYKGGGGNSYNAGLTDYLYDYHLWEGISFVKFKIGPIPTKLKFDYIVNTADHVPSDQDTAYFAGFKLGKEKKKGDWSLFYKYARIERDAVVGSMNDQDFYGANRKGHKAAFRYMLFDRLRLGFAYFYTDPVEQWPLTDPNFNNDRNREHEDRIQSEFVFKF
ncbi:MAG: putative porin [Deltaproteobacteria bacterium]|nr:putative porin [Deltaproteobacteria bacterium]